MDFRRIQWLLVFFFMVFNIYLIFMLFDRVNTYNTQPNQQEATTIESDLLSRGVVFEYFSEDRPEVPLLKSGTREILKQKLHQLKNQEVAIDENGLLESQFHTPLDLGIDLSESSDQSFEEQWKLLDENFLVDGSRVIEGQAYHFCRYYPDEQLMLLRMADGQGNEIADGTAELRLEFDADSQLVYYTQTYQDEIKTLDTKVEIISERTAMELIDKRVETVIPDHANIISSHIAYYQSSALQDFNVYSPAWEFTYQEENGHIRSILFDAVRGSVISRGR